MKDVMCVVVALELNLMELLRPNTKRLASWRLPYVNIIWLFYILHVLGHTSVLHHERMARCVEAYVVSSRGKHRAINDKVEQHLRCLSSGYTLAEQVLFL